MGRWSGFRRGEAAVAAVLLALGLSVIWDAAAMPAGTVALPGPGVFPTALGALLAALGAGILAGIGVAGPRVRPAEGDRPVDLAGREAIVTAAALAGAALAFQPVGAIATLAVFLAVLFRCLARIAWWKAALAGALGAALAWAVFARLLGVQLPTGITGI